MPEIQYGDFYFQLPEDLEIETVQEAVDVFTDTIHSSDELELFQSHFDSQWFIGHCLHLIQQNDGTLYYQPIGECNTVEISATHIDQTSGVPIDAQTDILIFKHSSECLKVTLVQFLAVKAEV
jgi:hypothetical protein